MRIIGGTWGGRRLKAPKGVVVRPTADRVREALFSSIESRFDVLPEASVLDCYAGTGALGLEALSRGARHATFVESDRRVAEVLRQNLQMADSSATCLVVNDISLTVSRRDIPGRPFSLLFLDPPYKLKPVQVRAVIESIVAVGLLVSGAVVVYEHDGRQEPLWPTRFEPIFGHQYGGTTISVAVYRKGE